MSVKKPKSTMRLITNRASTVKDVPSPSSMNATSYGVKVAVKSRNVPTSASQYIIRGLRGFKSHGFFWLSLLYDVGKPKRAFSSSSSGFKIVSFSSRELARCGSKSSTGPPYARDAEAPKRDFPVIRESRALGPSSSASLDATLSAPKLKCACFKLADMFCWFLSSKLASCTPVYRPAMTPPLVPQPFCPRRPAPTLEGPQPPAEAPSVTCPPPSPNAALPTYAEPPRESVEARDNAEGSSSPSREALGARRPRRAPPNRSRCTGSEGAFFAAAEARLRSRMFASASVPDLLASASLPSRDRPLPSRIVRPCLIEEDGPELSEWPNASPDEP